jgi:hypothetical protein
MAFCSGFALQIQEGRCHLKQKLKQKQSSIDASLRQFCSCRSKVVTSFQQSWAKPKKDGWNYPLSTVSISIKLYQLEISVPSWADFLSEMSL